MQHAGHVPRATTAVVADTASAFDERGAAPALVGVAARASTRRRSLPTGVVAGVIALVVIVGGAVAWHFHSLARTTARTQDELDATNARAAGVAADLRAADAARDQAVAAERLARHTLQDARTTSAQARHDVAAQRARLGQARLAVERSLVGARADVARLITLRQCLDGVSDALNRFGTGDVAGAEGALQASAAVCNQAEAP